MGSYKDQAIEEAWLAEHLCVCCEDSRRTEECQRCGELILCRLCLENGARCYCDYCEHMIDKDD